MAAHKIGYRFNDKASYLSFKALFRGGNASCTGNLTLNDVDSECAARRKRCSGDSCDFHDFCCLFVTNIGGYSEAYFRQ